MRMKTPPQPLVFRLEGAEALCSAVAELYRRWPQAPSCLCMWRGAYFLQVEAGLCQRGEVRRTAGAFGKCLGACPVRFAFCREHGEEISLDPVAELGRALDTGGDEPGDTRRHKNCK